MTMWLVWWACAKKIEPAAVPDPLTGPLPVDSDVLIGQLPNGLTWFVQQNTEPKGRAVLRLVVDAGSILEDEDQRGVAHFVEHMAFNGTTHFPGNSIITTLESMGAEFGPHINAHTSFDETVYKLFVPTDDAKVFDQSLLVLHDWASGLTFDRAEAEKERKVVLEEWRTGLGAQRRIEEVTVPAIYGELYASRLPIGTEESLRTFDPAAAERFYRDWYRPSLMAVIAVGDFDVFEVSAQIQQQFADLRDPPQPRERVRPDIADHEDTRYAIVADPEIGQTAMQILAQHDDREENTHRAYRDGLVKQLAYSVLDERLSDLSSAADPPFIGAGAGEDRLSPSEGATILTANARPDGIEPAYEALLLEARRLRERGVGVGELARAKARIAQQYESLYREKDQEDSTDAAEEIIRVYTTGEPMPGTSYEVLLARQWLPEITAEEVQAWAEHFVPATSRSVVVLEPADGTPPPTAAALAAIEARVGKAKLPRLVEDAEIGPVVRDLPAPGAITSVDRAYEPGLGFVGYRLSNGVTVWAKRTDFKADEVLFSATSRGGESKIADEDLPSARMLTAVAGESGVGEHDKAAHEAWLAGKNLALGLIVSETSEGLGGSASPADLEAALQSIAALFRAPRLADDAFARTADEWRAWAATRTNDPGTVFDDAWRALVWTSPRYAPWTPAVVDQARLERIRALYGERFGDASDFTFTFVGALPENFEDLLKTYLATLPAAGKAEDVTDLGLRPTMGQLQTTVHAGTDPQAQVRLEWRGPFPENSWEGRSRLYALGSALDVQLRNAIREDLGGTYGVGVSASESFEPYGWYTVRVEFGCDPARVDELVAATLRVIDAMRQDGPTDALAAQIREQNRREREQQLRTNGFWLGAFSGALRRGADPAKILTYDERNDALTPAVIRDTARSLLVDADRVQVVLLPQ